MDSILSKNSTTLWLFFFKKKIEIFEIQNFNRIPSFTICFFYFVLFLTSFFFLFYLSMVFKKIVKLLYCFIVWIRDFIKRFCKTMVFFFKKLRYLKSKISTKFHRLLFLYYFFSIFGILFSISPIQTCPKIKEFFIVFYWKG